MSLQFILDGYNIIKTSQLFCIKENKNTPEALVNFIRYHRPQGSPKNKVSIIFDGKPWITDVKCNENIEVLFTHDCSADDKIKKLVEDSSNPKQIIVVTNDRDIQFFVRGFNARVMSVEQFLKKSKKNKKMMYSKSPKFELTTQQAIKITDELKKIWLRDEERAR